MSFVALVLSMAMLGLVVGGLARFFVPGPDRLSLAWTSALGVAGMLFGGLVGKALVGGPGAPVFAVLTSIAILSAYRALRRSRPSG